jgi:dihydropteroate synthase
VDQVYAALEDGGVTEKTIVDPAFGGWSEDKTLEDDRETFRRLGEFRGLDRPILVSINRKNFLRKYVDRSTEAALPVSLGATAMAVERGADVVRTHDVAATRDAARIGRAFAADRVAMDGSVAAREIDAGTRRELARHLDRIGASVEYARDGVSHAIEIDGLDSAATEHLATIAADADVTVADGTDAVLVLGCERDLDRFVDGLSNGGDEFRTIATAVSRVIE